MKCLILLNIFEFIEKMVLKRIQKVLSLPILVNQQVVKFWNFRFKLIFSTTTGMLNYEYQVTLIQAISFFDCNRNDVYGFVGELLEETFMLRFNVIFYTIRQIRYKNYEPNRAWYILLKSQFFWNS